jgi:hypothetical protein
MCSNYNYQNFSGKTSRIIKFSKTVSSYTVFEVVLCNILENIPHALDVHAQWVLKYNFILIYDFTIMYGEVKNKIYHTVRTVPKSNRKIAETEAKSIPLTHKDMTSHIPVVQ